jgi:hypothetical protein
MLEGNGKNLKISGSKTIHNTERISPETFGFIARIPMVKICSKIAIPPNDGSRNCMRHIASIPARALRTTARVIANEPIPDAGIPVASRNILLSLCARNARPNGDCNKVYSKINTQIASIPCKMTSATNVRANDGREIPEIPNTPPVSESHDLINESNARTLAKVNTANPSFDSRRYSNENINPSNTDNKIVIINAIQSVNPFFIKITSAYAPKENATGNPKKKIPAIDVVI